MNVQKAAPIMRNRWQHLTCAVVLATVLTSGFTSWQFCQAQANTADGASNSADVTHCTSTIDGISTNIDASTKNSTSTSSGASAGIVDGAQTPVSATKDSSLSELK